MKYVALRLKRRELLSSQREMSIHTKILAYFSPVINSLKSSVKELLIFELLYLKYYSNRTKEIMMTSLYV